MQNCENFITNLNETIRFVNSNLQQNNPPIILPKDEVYNMLWNIAYEYSKKEILEIINAKYKY